eukprot:171714_1
MTKVTKRTNKEKTNQNDSNHTMDVDKMKQLLILILEFCFYLFLIGVYWATIGNAIIPYAWFNFVTYKDTFLRWFHQSNSSLCPPIPREEGIFLSLLFTPVIKSILCGIREIVVANKGNNIGTLFLTTVITVFVKEHMLLVRDVVSVLSTFIGWIAVQFDFKRIEFRSLLHLSKEEERIGRLRDVCNGLQICTGWLISYGVFSPLIWNLLGLQWVPFMNWTEANFYVFLKVFVAVQIRLVCVNLVGHRGFSHRSYDTSRVFKCILAMIHPISCQRGALWWSGLHRQHHKYSDQEGDPHSPFLYGVIYAHFGWIMDREYYSLNVPRVGDREEMISSDQSKPELLLVEAFYLLWRPLVDDFLFEGLLGLSKAERELSLCASFHLEWCINSICHWTFGLHMKDAIVSIFGSNDGDKKRDSSIIHDLPLLAMLNSGEGFHAGHHERPRESNHGWKYRESIANHKWKYMRSLISYFDLTYATICLLEFFGLIWNVQRGRNYGRKRGKIPKE